MMKFSTTRFGDIDVADQVVWTFPSGLIGFTQYTRFALLEDTEGLGYQWLQSLDAGDIAFVVIDPGLLLSDYHVEIQDTTLQELEFQEGDHVVIFAIVRIPPGCPQEATVNLQGPLVMNCTKRRGEQIVLNESVPLRFPLLSDTSDEKLQGQEGTPEVVRM